jgi:hypothetical protein
MRTTRAGKEPEVLLDRWVARLETTGSGTKPRGVKGNGAPNPQGGERTPVGGGLLGAQLVTVRDAVGTIELRGSSVVFSDAAGGTIVLGRSGDRVAHIGTLAVRGPYGLTLESLQTYGLSEAQARGLEFVAAWFGAPFDAVAVNRAEGGRSLKWGFWPLPAGDIGRAFALWKERSPVSFAGLLGDYGFDVSPGDGELSGPYVLLIDPAKGSLVRGDGALDFIARDPRRLALLARAGRHADARAAQLEVALRDVLPLFRMSLLRGQERVSLSTIAASARITAVTILASRGVELTIMAEILGRVSLPTDADDESKLLTALLDALADARPTVAMALRRALSSPELGE